MSQIDVTGFYPYYIKEKIPDIKNIIANNNTFFISSHLKPDGDAIGSAIALMKFLQKLGKKAQIINQHSIPSIYSFLIDKKPISYVSKNKIPLKEKYFWFILDTNDFKMLGNGINEMLSNYIQQKKYYIIL